MEPATQRSRLVADSHDPWISVHTLGEYIFCPRAGLLAQETAGEDIGEEKFFARGGPRKIFYSIDEILRQLKTHLFGAAIAVTGACALWWLRPEGVNFFWPIPIIFVIVCYFYRQITWRGLVPWCTTIGSLAFLFAYLSSLVFTARGMTRPKSLQIGAMGFHAAMAAAGLLKPIQIGALGFLAAMAAAGLLQSLILFARYLRAILAREKVPDPNHQEPQKIYWWNLIQAGYTQYAPSEAMGDPKWRLAGKPWRVLKKGNLRIPVFRKRSLDEKLYKQHFARIAAYCHLLETCEGGECPYGIVMLGSTLKGLTVPCRPPARKAFHHGLIDARTMIRIIPDSGLEPGAPSNLNLCYGCPWGKPERGADISACGMRFNWIPPHEYS